MADAKQTELACREAADQDTAHAAKPADAAGLNPACRPLTADQPLTD